MNAVPEVLSQKDAIRNGVSEPFLPNLDIINTSPAPTKFCVTICVWKLFSVEKKYQCMK
jgi:hypothetical protein